MVSWTASVDCWSSYSAEQRNDLVEANTHNILPFARHLHCFCNEQVIFLKISPLIISQIHVSLRKKCKGKKRKNCEVKSFNVGSLTRGHKIQCPAKERNFSFHIYYIVMSPVLVQFRRGRQSGPDLTQVPRALPEQIQLSVEAPGHMRVERWGGNYFLQMIR